MTLLDPEEAAEQIDAAAAAAAAEQIDLASDASFSCGSWVCTHRTSERAAVVELFPG